MALHTRGLYRCGCVPRYGAIGERQRRSFRDDHTPRARYSQEHARVLPRPAEAGREVQQRAHRAWWELQCDHLAYLRSQVEAGRYFFGGPVTDGGAIVGVTVIQAGSLAEAEAIMAADPGVQAGLFSFEGHPVRLPSLESLTVEY